MIKIKCLRLKIIFKICLRMEKIQKIKKYIMEKINKYIIFSHIYTYNNNNNKERHI